MGTSASYNPWAFQEKDEVMGFEIDIWEEIANRNNYELEIKLGQFSGLIGMLDAGEIDTITSNVNYRRKRKKIYFFFALCI